MTSSSTIARASVSVSAADVACSGKGGATTAAASIEASEGATEATVGAAAGAGAAAATGSATGTTGVLNAAGGSVWRGDRVVGFSPAGGGATTTTGRGGTAAPAGALATTGPAGGREAIAGAGGTTAVEADRGWGTILRGSGRLGCGGTTVTGGATGAAAAGGRIASEGAAGAALERACRLCFASCSSFCLVARMAFNTSPGLEM